ncbi:MAG: dephospho-CoA kinase [Patescibacteria group bacterium]
MKLFGITGNIGCGKSTVCKLLSKYNDIVIIDCDQIAKEIIASSTHRQDLIRILGIEIYPHGQVDFQSIGKVIFSDDKKKRLLEEFVHPHVWKAVEERVTLVHPSFICIVESALIFETKSEERFNGVVAVVCDDAEQFRRLETNRKMGREEYYSRQSHQLPSSLKESRAQFVIDTNCSLKELEQRVQNLYHNLKTRKAEL